MFIPRFDQFRGSFERLPVRACCVWVALSILTDCATPQHRADEKAAAFHRLSLNDQRLVLGGNVRWCLDQVTVYIALRPASICPPGPMQGPLEAWLSTHKFNGPDGRYFGTKRGLIYAPELHRYVYSNNDFYEAPVYIRGFIPVTTDVPYRSALFDHRRMVSFEAF